MLCNFDWRWLCDSTFCCIWILRFSFVLSIAFYHLFFQNNFRKPVVSSFSEDKFICCHFNAYKTLKSFNRLKVIDLCNIYLLNSSLCNFILKLRDFKNGSWKIFFFYNNVLNTYNRPSTRLDDGNWAAVLNCWKERDMIKEL